jgi:uncharacterized membrane protein
VKRLISILRTTIVGGVIFLVPFVVLIIILGKALQISRAVTVPLAERIPVESVMGLGTPKILAAVVLVLVCLLAGLFAKTSLAKKLVNWLEKVFLSNVPGYSFLKHLAEETAGTAPERGQQTVLVRFDEASQIGFLIERISGGRVAVFVPDAPNPLAGGVFIVDEDRVTPLDVPSGSALKCLQRLGEGSGSIVTRVRSDNNIK